MSFYTPQSDMQIDGSEENSNIRSFEKIPEGTHATAKIIRAELINDKDGKYYQIEYELTAGDFSGLHVRQNIKAFDADPKKRDRGVNQIVRLFKLSDYKPSHNLAPTTEDLKPILGKYIGIVIGQWWAPTGDKGGNYIRETHTSVDFKCKTGVFKEAPHPVDTVPQQYQQYSNMFSAQAGDNDIPF